MKKIFESILVIVCCVLLCVSCGGNQQNKSLEGVQAVSAENTGAMVNMQKDIIVRGLVVV